eukprot:CAMPEP_0174252008 /NCGR_PEP_ID=MMETSP0439-20130205/1658_1 /TAXON_ID=0 /ORGANISM="Stereomyxa ramosa, Strain Chinc5" /LENGTH=228 /DNA_ID=CAMNT_0015332477 /DNA_START=303 /DNA_END=989 /DNA_ORIENTATION=-
MADLGINNSDHLLLYDHSMGQFVASARVWWTFKVFGHENVSVLEGGFANWPAGLTFPKKDKLKGEYKAKKNEKLVWDLHKMMDTVDHHDALIIDARPAQRFYGEVPEPREDVQKGSIPGSVNVPFLSLFDKLNNKNNPDVFILKPPDKLKEIFTQQGIDTNGRIVTSCGSGVTASVVALALETLGNKEVGVYDGSWTEWALDLHTPKVIARKKPPPDLLDKITTTRYK